MASAILRVTNLSKEFGIYNSGFEMVRRIFNPFEKTIINKVQALSDINIEVKHGESVGIIGKNGSGKSTLLKIITGVLSPTSGNVEVSGRIASLLELGAGFNPELSGLENIYTNGTLVGLTTDEIEKKVPDILNFADIGDFIYQPIKTYSSGMFARLAFATAINIEPDILIVDEALSVGDIFFQQKCFHHIKTNLNGVTKLFVTHDMASLSQIADRVIVIEKGKVVFDGAPLEAVKFYQTDDHKQIKHTISDTAFSEVLIQETFDAKKFQHKLNVIDGNTLSGVQEQRLVGHLCLVNGQPSDLVSEGDSIEIVADIEASRPTHGKCVVGILFRDVQAQMVLAENTLNEAITDVKINTGISRLSIKFKWPKIKRGEYTYTLGIGEVNPNNDIEHNIQCWANNIGRLYSETGYKHDGLHTLEVSEISVRSYKK